MGNKYMQTKHHQYIQTHAIYASRERDGEGKVMLRVG